MREIELLNNTHAVVRDVDSETWRELRDLFIKKRIIAQDDRGHYLLSRDLNSIQFWQLKEWVNDERPLDKEDVSAHMSWQENAYALLRQQRTDQRELLEKNLVELFEA